MRAAIIAAIASLVLSGCGDTYTVVRVCKSPFMRVPNGKVVKRDRDGVLFYSDKSVMLKVDPNVSIDDICRKQ